MPLMKSIQEHRFANRLLAIGSEFEATDHEARVLIATGRAVPAATEQKSMQAEQPAASPRRKRGYQRRDITTQRETK